MRVVEAERERGAGAAAGLRAADVRRVPPSQLGVRPHCCSAAPRRRCCWRGCTYHTAAPSHLAHPRSVLTLLLGHRVCRRRRRPGWRSTAAQPRAPCCAALGTRWKVLSPCWSPAPEHCLWSQTGCRVPEARRRARGARGSTPLSLLAALGSHEIWTPEWVSRAMATPLAAELAPVATRSHRQRPWPLLSSATPASPRRSL